MGQETPQVPYKRVTRPPQDGNFVYNCVHVFATCVIPIFARFKVEGYENMPLTGGCVLTCNHAMGPDFLAIGYGTRRKIYFMAKQELFEVQSRPYLAVQRERHVSDQARRDWIWRPSTMRSTWSRKATCSGMFPEGTRSRTGKLQRGRSGAARIAIQAQAPVVPAYVHGVGPVFKRQQLSELEAAGGGDGAHWPPAAPAGRCQTTRVRCAISRGRSWRQSPNWQSGWRSRQTEQSGAKPTSVRDSARDGSVETVGLRYRCDFPKKAPGRGKSCTLSPSSSSRFSCGCTSKVKSTCRPPAAAWLPAIIHAGLTM